MSGSSRRGRYEPTRVAFLKHLEDGRISYPAFSLHHYLRCRVRAAGRPGWTVTSAPEIAAAIGLPVTTVQAQLRELKTGGYIVDFRKPGQPGRYPILVDGFELWRETEAVRVRAHETTDFRRPVTAPVTDDRTEDSTGDRTDNRSEKLTEDRRHRDSSTQKLRELEEYSPPSPPVSRDYVAEWNAAVADLTIPEIRTLTAARRRQIRTRESEAAWDWPALLSELARLDDFALDGSWLTFDWTLKPANFVKLLEGNFRRKEAPQNQKGPDGLLIDQNAIEYREGDIRA